MCLMIFAYRVHPDYPLLLAANRDEFYARPTAPASYWKEHPALLAGRDLEAGGTWMGLTQSGRFAAVTNFRDPARSLSAPRSRGELPLKWLTSERQASELLAELESQDSDYAGFNLLLGDRDALWYYSNADKAPAIKLEPGIYGLSNAKLNSPWPKVIKGKARIAELLSGPIDHQSLLDTVHDKGSADPAELELLGLQETMDAALSAQFISTEVYGTVSSTTLIWQADGQLSWRERTYDSQGNKQGVVQQDLQLA
ncbi:NRDE family protein [Parahaliea sp. F7430]|uniref:NRDE family protein n=1 Tax=Sediminihaliea albiluteola TaxID=2758564 RepID=A0A7W2TX12_9GAMM|nr:NRDE family protein [Sediminihaliea albiluteola]MBA6413521.1 NRDE family protein [Sediminihaliea albiluteola]